jgi:hypothetical protein
MSYNDESADGFVSLAEFRCRLKGRIGLADRDRVALGPYFTAIFDTERPILDNQRQLA